MKRGNTPAALSILWVSLVLATSSGCPPSPEEFYNCPDSKSSIVDEQKRCVCKQEGARFVNYSMTCQDCDSAGAAGRFCACDSRNLISAVSTTCEVCPQSCEGLECMPEGCSAACKLPGCPAGKYCSKQGRCEPCGEGSCGGACGSCPPGLTCVIGKCVAVTKCCVGVRFCSEAPTWCLWSGVWPQGYQCHCNYDDQSPNLYNAFEPDAPNGAPNTWDGITCTQQLSGQFCPF